MKERYQNPNYKIDLELKRLKRLLDISVNTAFRMKQKIQHVMKCG